MRVYVVQISEILPHPNADRVEILRLTRPGWGIDVIAGLHYKVGQLGVYVPAGAIIPGWLAEDMWLVGAGNANRWYPVESKIIRGVESHGLFAGQMYKKVRDDERSVRRYEKLKADGGEPKIGDWINWPIWQARWKAGDDVGDYIGVQCPEAA